MKKYFFFVFTAILFFASQNSFAQFNRKHSDDGTSQPTNSNTNAMQSTSPNKTEDEPLAKGFDKSKIIFGGNIGLAFGSSTYFEATPLLGYRFTKRIGAGLSGNYVYSGVTWTDPNTNLKQSQNYQVYGGGVWGRFYAMENLFLVSEFQLNRISISQNIVNNTYDIKSQWYQSLLIGVGYRQRISNRASINLILMYDVLQQYPLYQGIPILKGGVIFGI